MHHHRSGQRPNLVIGAVQNKQRHGRWRQCSGQALPHREYLGSGPSPDPAPVYQRVIAVAAAERAANEVVTGPFVDSLHQQFAKEVASGPAIAVKSLDGDRAIGLVFLDQQARQGGEGKP